MRLARAVLLIATALALVAATPLVAGGPTTLTAGASNAAPAAPVPHQGWTDTVTGPTEPYVFQGPAAGDLAGNGVIDLVVAFPDGLVKAYNAHTGQEYWEIQTDGTISSTPSLADLHHDGRLDVIVTTRGGSVYVLDSNGRIEPGWPQHSIDGWPATSFPNAFFSSPAVGDLFGDGNLEITASSWDHFLYAWYPNGQWVSGFPIDLSDTSWSTPAIVPDNSPQNGNDILVGGDSSGPSFHEPYPAGGMWFRFPNTGCPFPAWDRLSGGQACNQVGNWPTHINQTTWSSAAVYNDGDAYRVATGSGFYFGAPDGGACPDATCGRQLTVYNLLDGTIAWERDLDGQVNGSPAVGDVGNGDAHDIVVTTNGGSVYEFDHAGNLLVHVANGTYQWSNPVIGPVDSAGTRGVWVGNGAYLEAFVGDKRVRSFAFGTGFVPGAPAVFNDGTGLTVAAVGSLNALVGTQWQVQVHPLTGDGIHSNVAAGVGSNAWVRFHGDSHADGEASTTVPPSVPYGVTATAADGVATVSWHAPADPGSAPGRGYRLDAFTTGPGGADIIVGSQPEEAPANAAPGAVITARVPGLHDGQAYWFRVQATWAASSELSVPSLAVTPTSSRLPAVVKGGDVSSTSQYRLPGSDGVTWQDLGGLAQTVTPPATGSYLLSASGDLWASMPGVGEDLGICVRTIPGVCAPADIVAWSESGAGTGVFTPASMHVQSVLTLAAGSTYDVRLVWKATVAGGGAIFAGAGAPPSYSPTTLSARPSTVLGNAYSNEQYILDGSDGTTWQPVADSAHVPLTVSFSGGASGAATITTTTAAWSDTPTVGEFVGLFVSGGRFGTGNHGLGSLVTFGEWGTTEGTFSPSAWFLRAAVPTDAGTTYTVHLAWRSTIGEAGRIYLGAGGPGTWSPTTIAVIAGRTAG